MAGRHAPDAGRDADDPLIIDTDASWGGAQSDKQGAAPTFKRGYGFHPLCAFVDHGPDGSGEPLAVMLRPGNAGSVRHEVAQFEWSHRLEVRLMSRV